MNVTREESQTMDQSQAYDDSLLPSQQPVVEFNLEKNKRYWVRRRERRLARFYARVQGGQRASGQRAKASATPARDGRRAPPVSPTPHAPPSAKRAERGRDAALAGANDMIAWQQLWEVVQRIDENLRLLRQLAESRQLPPAVFTPP